MTSTRTRPLDVDTTHGIDTSKIARITITHELMAKLLGLPDDVLITSMHTSKRGELCTGIYMLCERFDRIRPGEMAKELTLDEVKSKGLWDMENNK